MSSNSFALRLPSPTVPKHFHFLVAALLAGLLVLGLCACGRGADQTVATVGKTKISKSTLNHWMSTMVGGDYQEIVGDSAPVGLVSEPANYPRCVAAAKTIKPKKLPTTILNAARLKIRCRQLYVAIKEQALSYLISVLWRAEEGAEVGQEVSDREVSRHVQELAYSDYKSPAAFRRFLASRHWSLADERYLLKRNLLDTKFLERLKRRVVALGGGQRTLGKLVKENVAEWSAKTSCSPGYSAWQCRPGGSTDEADPSAAVLVEELAGVPG
jgi:hypothetical protein